MIPESVEKGVLLTDGVRTGTVKFVLRDSGQIVVDWSDGTNSIMFEEDHYFVLPIRPTKS